MLALTGGGNVARRLADLMERSSIWLPADPMDLGIAVMLLRGVIREMVLALAPIALGTAAVALLVNLIQAKGVISLKPATPDLSKVSPLSGLKRIFSWQSPFTLLKSILKLTFLVAVAYVTIKRAWPEVLALVGLSVENTLVVLRRLVIKMALVTGLSFLAISVMDYLFQVYEYIRGLRMTRQEVTQEFKDIDGDPLIKSRIRSLALSMSRQRMLRDVPDADVVITNPTHLAIAIKYEPDKVPAPTVLAMGRRKMAQRIKAMAIAAGIPLVQNRPLAQTLMATATVGQPIPPALYTAVAEVLAFVYKGINSRIPQAVSQMSRAIP